METEVLNSTGSINSVLLFGGGALVVVALLFTIGSFINDRRRNKRITKSKKSKSHQFFSFSRLVEEERVEEQIEQIQKSKSQKKYNSTALNKKNRDESRELWKMQQEKNNRNR